MTPHESLRDVQVEAEYQSRHPWLTAKFLQNKRYLRRGGPKYLKVGRSIFYRRQDVEAYIESCLVDTTQEYHQRAR